MCRTGLDTVPFAKPQSKFAVCKLKLGRQESWRREGALNTVMSVEGLKAGASDTAHMLHCTSTLNPEPKLPVKHTGYFLFAEHVVSSYAR